MGIAEKKPDILVAVHGTEAERYRSDSALLLQGRLPEGWHWVPCSRDAVVAATDAAPFVFYKEFLPRSPVEKIKSLIRGSRCERARQQSDILGEVGLGSPRVLAWGRGRRNEFLVTAAFAGVGFFQFLTRNFSGPLSRSRWLRKRALLEAAGFLIGTMHSRGISHGDLRQDNLLVREEVGGFEFCFIDNESNRLWRQVPEDVLVTNLVQFSISSGHVLTRSDLLRLFAAYGKAYPRFPGKKRQRLLARVMERSRRRILHYIVKAALERASCFESARGTGCYVSQSVVEAVLEAGQDFEAWFAQGEFLKSDGQIQVKKIGGPGGVIVAKRFLGRGLLSLLKNWLRQERPPRLWRMSHIFMALEIPIARPLGYLLAGRGPWRRQSYFFSAFAEGKQDLLSLSRQQPGLLTRLLDQGLFGDIAQYLARLHNHGQCHGDTKWANIMVDPASGELLFIDLDGAGPVRHPLGRRIIKDVSRFVVDMLEQGVALDHVRRFIREYSNMRVVDRRLVQAGILPHINKALVRHGRQDIDLQPLRQA